MLKRVLLLFPIVLFVFASFAVAESPVDGKWTAEVVRPAPAGNQNLTIMLNTTEGKVTGSMTIQGVGDVPIEWGFIKGDMVTLKVKVPGNNGAITTFVYLGRVDGDQISFGRRPEDLTMGRLVEFTAKRAK